MLLLDRIQRKFSKKSESKQTESKQVELKPIEYTYTDIQNKIAESLDYFSKSHIISEHNLQGFMVSSNDSIAQLPKYKNEIDIEQIKLNDLKQLLDNRQSDLNILQKSKSQLDKIELKMFFHTSEVIQNDVASLAKKVNEQQREVNNKINGKNALEDDIFISAQYIGIDLDFLAMKKKHTLMCNDDWGTKVAGEGRLPVFATFKYYTNDKFTLEYRAIVESNRYQRYGFDSVVSSGLPIFFDKKYNINYDNTADNILFQNDLRNSRIKVYTSFLGFIPEQTKLKIEKAKKIFAEDIYLIAEAKEYNVEQIKPVSDPLVIGVKHDKAYLIDAFDCTPLETFVKESYTGGKPKQN